MIAPDHIRKIHVSPAFMGLIRHHAKEAQVGGKSQVRNPESRLITLQDDQLTGQIAEFAGCMWLYGEPSNYLRSRIVANQRRWSGDRGADVIGSNIDWKGTLLRYTPPVDLAGNLAANFAYDLTGHMLRYRLAVRPAERHIDNVYVLVLVEPLQGERTNAHLVGWAADAMLPTEPAKDGPLAGAFLLPAAQLHPLPPFKWGFFPNREPGSHTQVSYPDVVSPMVG